MNLWSGCANIYNFRDRFFEIFTHPDAEYSLSISVVDAKEKTQLNYLFGYLDKLGCESVLVESEYVDHDFLDNYANFYAKSFLPYNKFCRRAHFFDIDVEQLVLDSVFVHQEAGEVEKLRDSYLGFMVIRPLPYAVVGRTVLRDWGNLDRVRSIKCLREYKPNLFGLDLPVTGLAFQEQDGAVSACATAALWSCLHVTAEKFDTPIMTPTEITRAATRYFQTARALPTSGLTVEQVNEAIFKNGLEPEVYRVDDTTPVNSLICAYLDAKIPVFLGYEYEGTNKRHAVAVLGYSTDQQVVHERETFYPAHNLDMIGRRVVEFYAHDDQLGPYARFECETRTWHEKTTFGRKRKKVLNPRVFNRKLDSMSDSSKICVPTIIIVPVYHKIRLSFIDIYKAIKKINIYIEFLKIRFQDNPSTGSLDTEWRIRLLDIKQLKSEVSDSSSLDDEIRGEILYESQPKYQWESSVTIQGHKLFSLLSDATDIRRSFYFRKLVFEGPTIKESFVAIIKKRDPELRAAARVSPAFAEFLGKSLGVRD